MALSLVELVALAQRGLLLCVVISLPVLAVAALCGLAAAVFQAATQSYDAALGHLPKFVGVALVLAALGPWMGHQILNFTLYVLGAP